MSLKCSIFGHRFDATDVEREREEQGSEVVITIREVETCDRCGESRVVSENKEVTTLETPDLADAEKSESEAEGDSSGERAPDAGTAAADSQRLEGSDTAEHGDDARDAELVDTDGPVAEEPTSVPDAEGGTAATAGPESTTAGEDGGTASAQSGTGVQSTGPQHASEEDDGVIIDEQRVPESTAERSPGEWPEESQGDEPDWVSESDHTAPTLDEDSSSRIDKTGAAVTVPEGKFHCEECGFSTAVEASSLRAGDFCPDCHQGTLTHIADSE